MWKIVINQIAMINGNFISLVLYSDFQWVDDNNKSPFVGGQS